jgi:hypothetical protein
VNEQPQIDIKGVAWKNAWRCSADFARMLDIPTTATDGSPAD